MAEAANVARLSAIKLEPEVWLGAYSPGGLQLPDARPSAAHMYAPRGVFMNDDVFIAADSGNHRILIWRGMPQVDGQPADVVLGQPDFTSEGPKLLHLPTGVAVIDGKLLVADAWHHRVLVWNTVPTTNDTPPDSVLGQPDLSALDPNRGGAISAQGLYWPYGLAFVDGWFYVADTGNRRVLGWRGLPQPNQPADLVLGQPNFGTGDENRGGAVDADSFRWPHAIAGNADVLYVADAGDHRVLGWSPKPAIDAPANVLLGQPDFTSAREWPYGKQGPSTMRFPYAVAVEGDLLAVADTANNRVLMWRGLPKSGAYRAADCLIGQCNFDENGENRWKAVERDTLCWPYGICLHGGLHSGRLAVADSGNNRVMVWRIEQE